MKNHKNKIKKFSPTTIGYNELSEYDPKLAEAARDVAMLYLPHHYRKGTKEEMIEGFHSLVKVANLAGFKMRITNYKIGKRTKFVKKFPIYRDYSFYRELFARFRNEIENITNDPNDKHGLCDESVKVANITLKYHHFIAMRIKKKGILEKIKIYFENITQ